VLIAAVDKNSRATRRVIEFHIRRKISLQFQTNPKASAPAHSNSIHLFLVQHIYNERVRNNRRST
jgi:hypothetical protein